MQGNYEIRNGCNSRMSDNRRVLVVQFGTLSGGILLTIALVCGFMGGMLSAHQQQKHHFTPWGSNISASGIERVMYDSTTGILCNPQKRKPLDPKPGDLNGLLFGNQQLDPKPNDPNSDFFKRVLGNEDKQNVDPESPMGQALASRERLISPPYCGDL
jgi:hypothetical protein